MRPCEPACKGIPNQDIDRRYFKEYNYTIDINYFLENLTFNLTFYFTTRRTDGQFHHMTMFAL